MVGRGRRSNPARSAQAVGAEHSAALGGGWSDPPGDIDHWGAHAFFLPSRQSPPPASPHRLAREPSGGRRRSAATYHATAFIVAVALFVRLASKRFDLTGKPWHVLSFVLGAHTGEVWFNLTNLHYCCSTCQSPFRAAVISVTLFLQRWSRCAASLCGSRSPATIASGMVSPVVPVMSVNARCRRTFI